MKTFLMVVMLLLAWPAVAATDAATEEEARYLIKIANELNHLIELAKKSKTHADPDARISLDYVALENDLTEIQRALEQHVKRPSRSPRRLRALELPGSAR